jgi:hypothetical protein
MSGPWNDNSSCEALPGLCAASVLCEFLLYLQDGGLWYLLKDPKAGISSFYIAVILLVGPDLPCSLHYLPGGGHLGSRMSYKHVVYGSTGPCRQDSVENFCSACTDYTKRRMQRTVRVIKFVSYFQKSIAMYCSRYLGSTAKDG